MAAASGRRARVAVVAGLAAVAVGAGAQEAGWEGGDAAAMEELMAILDEETTAATRTRLNSDVVPGMVTVLQGEDLEALGVATVWEALSLVPGLQTYRSGLGEPFVTVRGVPFPFNSGNIKILVNSVAMTRETSSVNPSVLLLPVEQVERIEVVRGPSSSVYGDFAFLGVVNIVTQKGETGAFASRLADAHTAAGAQVSTAAGPLRFDANVAGWTSGQGEGPVTGSGDEERLSAIAAAAWGGTALSYQVFERTFERQAATDERNQAVDLRHHRQLAPAWHVDADAGYLDTDVEAPTIAFRGDLLRAEVEVGHTTTGATYRLALSGVDANIDRAELNTQGRPLGGALVEDSGWQQVGVSAQGQFDLRADLSATVGARLDYRFDLEAHSLAPRLALVWRSRRDEASGRQHLVKGQYAVGSRAPTFFELHGLTATASTLGFEHITTTEASYIYRDLRRTARLTVYASRLDDMIFPFGSGTAPPPGGPPPPAAGFRNVAAAAARGLEAEWEQQLHASLKWGANLSWSWSEDNRTTDATVGTPHGAARWLWNTHLVGRPWSPLLLGAHLYHVGQRESGTRDTPGYDRLDVTASLPRLGGTGLVLRAGVKNLLDDTIRHVESTPFGARVLVHEPRSWWVRVSYEL